MMVYSKVLMTTRIKLHCTVAAGIVIYYRHLDGIEDIRQGISSNSALLDYLDENSRAASAGLHPAR
jgi:hypothetical protein